MKVKKLLEKLQSVDPNLEVRIAGFRACSGIDHAYIITSAKLGYFTSDGGNEDEVCGKNNLGAKSVFLIREAE